jgi:hypothetical protein
MMHTQGIPDIFVAEELQREARSRMQTANASVFCTIAGWGVVLAALVAGSAGWL